MGSRTRSPHLVTLRRRPPPLGAVEEVGSAVPAGLLEAVHQVSPAGSLMGEMCFWKCNLRVSPSGLFFYIRHSTGAVGSAVLFRMSLSSHRLMQDSATSQKQYASEADSEVAVAVAALHRR